MALKFGGVVLSAAPPGTDVFVRLPKLVSFNLTCISSRCAEETKTVHAQGTNLEGIEV